MAVGHVRQKIREDRARNQLDEVLREVQARRRAEREARAAGASANWNTSSVLTEYTARPVEFCSNILRSPSPDGPKPLKLWSAQETLALAVAQHRRVAVRSCHKSGKSKLAAAIAIWWALTRRMARVILTAPTARQVEKALWYEIRSFYAVSPLLRQILPEPGLDPATGCRWADGRELFGFTASNADNVSGPGGPEVLVIIDEGPGVPRSVWEALQGVRAGGGKVLTLGNPTQTSGWFYDAFHERRAGWDLHHISGPDTPNVVAGEMVYPGLIDREFIQEIADDNDTDSPVYAVRVLGNFPANVANAVIGLGMLEAARSRWDDDVASPSMTIDLGVDVARFGDDYSAVSAREGLRVYTPAWFEKERDVKACVNGYDSTKVSGLALQCMSALRDKKQRVRIKIDSTGGYGGAVADRLRELQADGRLDEFVEVVEINFAETASEPDKYPRVRDELWFGFRKFCKDGGAIYDKDARCDSELLAPTYSLTSAGQNKVEPKLDTKKRLGRSPDRAESVLLAVYEPNTAVEDFTDDPVPEPEPESRWADTASY
ncbi:MAG TPA: hypothetical protein VG734_26005 [Lacunisphaera sp.]|nr:hypothetical protein [Lacunisphaera sp.]